MQKINLILLKKSNRKIEREIKEGIEMVKCKCGQMLDDHFTLKRLTFVGGVCPNCNAVFQVDGSWGRMINPLYTKNFTDDWDENLQMISKLDECIDFWEGYKVKLQ